MTAFLLAGIAACSRGSDLEPQREADAGGIGIEAQTTADRDSIRIHLEVTNNTDTSADITFDRGCPFTLIVRDEIENVVWDERESSACDGEDITLPLAPHEYQRLTHSVARSQEGLQLEVESELLVRVLVAQDQEYVLSTD